MPEHLQGQANHDALSDTDEYPFDGPRRIRGHRINEQYILINLNHYTTEFMMDEDSQNGTQSFKQYIEKTLKDVFHKRENIADFTFRSRQEHSKWKADRRKANWSQLAGTIRSLIHDIIFRLHLIGWKSLEMRDSAGINLKAKHVKHVNDSLRFTSNVLITFFSNH